MINRFLIRVKVIQQLYSYMLTRPDISLDKAIDNLNESFDKSYELYYYLLQLIVELTQMQDRRLDDAKHKFLPTEEDLNPNTRFIDNRVVACLTENEEFTKFCRDHKVSWADDVIFMRLLLDKVLNSEPYNEYMQRQGDTSFDDDAELWRTLLKDVILVDDDVLDHIENMSVNWSIEDVDVMGQFALKTIRRLQLGAEAPFSPKFKDEEDAQFGPQLLESTVNEMDDSNALIDSAVNDARWSHDRIAMMDRLIMCTAISEMRHYCLSIPVSVTLNEYIELAKIFSTPNSGQFVNGVLNAIAKKLKESGVIQKIGK